MEVIVETWADGLLEARKTIDYTNRADRKWLGKHCFWAFHNQREVRTYRSPRDDD